MSQDLKNTIHIKVGEEEVEVFMAFARLDGLSQLVGSVERVAEFDFNPEVRTEALALCLAPRTETGRAVGDWQVPETLAYEEAERLLDWIKEHVLGFFLRRLSRNLQLVRANKGTLLEVSS